jgi:hypothetical protein
MCDEDHRHLDLVRELDRLDMLNAAYPPEVEEVEPAF